MRNNKTIYVTLAACILIGILATVLLFHRQDDGRPSNHGAVGNYTQTAERNNQIDNHYIQNLETNWLYRFYDEATLERESFAIRRILNQTISGYFIAEVSYSGVLSPTNFPVLPVGQSQQSHDNIILVDSNLSEGRPFFNTTPQWERFYFVASCRRGYIYVLAHTHNPYEHDDYFAILYVYNQHGIEVSQEAWRTPISSSIRGAYVLDDYIVLDGFQLVIKTKQGEIVFEASQNDFLIAGTVGDGYFYGLYESGGNVLRRIEIPSGRVVSEHRLGWDYNNEIMLWPSDIAFCKATLQLYLYQFNALFVFNESTGGLQRVKDLTFSDSNVKVQRYTITEDAHISDLFFTVAAADLLHISLIINNFENGQIIPMEWTLTRLTDADAQRRMEEIAQAEADKPIVRMFCYTPGGVSYALRFFAFDRGATAEVFFLPEGTRTMFQTYVELLNTAIFSGTAWYDIINISQGQGNLQSLVDRGLLVDFNRILGNRFTDNERYFVNLFEHIIIDGGLYYLPSTISAPVLLVPLDFPELERLKLLSQNWTWAEFLEITLEIKADTGIPPITAMDAIFMFIGHEDTVPTNVLPFYLYNEDVLRELATGASVDDFRNTLEVFFALTSPELSQASGELGVFTFGLFPFLVDGVGFPGFQTPDFRHTHYILPIPTMFGERHFTLHTAAHAVLTTGESTDLATEFLIESFGQGINFDNPFNLIRPTVEQIERYTTLHKFDSYVAILDNVNTILQLPYNVTYPIREAVDSLLHGVLTLDAAVDRIVDIMWLYMNE